MADYNAAPQKRHPLGARPAQHAGSAHGAAAAAAAAAPPGEAGLQNATGEYNCFLNAVVQCLWHCTAFKDGLLRLPAGALQVRTLFPKALLIACLCSQQR